MVNLRYHIVSIVAVFLALAVGVLMGATVIDQGIVNVQKTNLSTLETRLEDRRARVRELEAEVEDHNEFLDDIERPAAAQLLDAAVLVLAMDGIEKGPLESLRADIAEGGVDLGVLWFTDKWPGDDSAKATSELRAATPAWVDDEPGETAQQRTVAALIDEIVSGTTPSTTTTSTLSTSSVSTSQISQISQTSQTAQPSQTGGVPAVTSQTSAADSVVVPSSLEPVRRESVLDALVTAGFVRIEEGDTKRDDAGCSLRGWCLGTLDPIGALESVSGESSATIVIAGGAGSKAADQLVPTLLAQAVVDVGTNGSGLVPTPVLVESAAPDAPQTPAVFVGPVREHDLGDKVSTVDDIGEVSGRLVALMAIDEVVHSGRGHYGTGPGADRRAPEPRG